MRARPATVADAPAIARILNEGIEDRIATFETQLRTPDDVLAWFDGRHPIVVVAAGDDGTGDILGFASTSTYRPRHCYSGIAEFSVYVARAARRQGVGSLAMDVLIAAAEETGFWKLVSRVFVENAASRALLASVGFREVGVYRRHGQLGGVWHDCVIVERLLGGAAEDGEDGAGAAAQGDQRRASTSRRRSPGTSPPRSHP